MQIPTIWIGAFVYANLITILSIGFTLTYMTLKIPNFAHGTYAGVGVYISYTFSRLLKLSPYVSLPIAFIFGGGVSVSTFQFIILFIMKMGGTSVSLTIATIAIDIFITALIYIYAYGLRNLYKTYTTQFLLKNLDINIFGLPGVLIVVSCINISTILLLHFLLTKTKTGIAMKATAEDAELASVLGIDIIKIQRLSWFLTGGIACLAGALLPLWFQGSPSAGTAMMTSVMAGSIVGGFQNIYGAFIGAFSIGLIEILATSFLQASVGTWIGEWRLIIPALFLNAVLLINPNGILGLYEKLKAVSRK